VGKWCIRRFSPPPPFWTALLGDLPFRSRRFRRSPLPRHSSHPIPVIPIWRGFRGKTPSTQFLGPRPSALIRGKKFFRSVSSVLISGQTFRFSNYPITRFPDYPILTPYPRHSSHHIPVIPIWRGFRGKTPSTQFLIRDHPRKKFFRSVSSVLISGQTCFPMSLDDVDLGDGRTFVRPPPRLRSQPSQFGVGSEVKRLQPNF
jgi:hypothetical protein